MTQIALGFAGKQLKFVNRLMYGAITAIILSIGGTTLSVTVEPVKRQAEDEKLSMRIDYAEKEIETKAPMSIVQYGISLYESQKVARENQAKQNDTIIKLLRKMSNGNR